MGEFDTLAVEALPVALEKFGKFASEMPSAAELIHCLRVISRAAAIATRDAEGIEVHLARGIVTKECDQYSLSEVLRYAEKPEAGATGRVLGSLITDLELTPGAICVISLRNDGELFQSLVLASIIKRREPTAVVILDTSGGNEQYSFGTWAQPFLAQRESIARFIDYFLPRQDYHVTLKGLLTYLDGGDSARVIPENLVVLRAGDTPLESIEPIRAIGDAFRVHIRNLSAYQTAGVKTILARLSPNKCHWAACKFCTINSQHLTPRGATGADFQSLEYAGLLLDVAQESGAESLVLTDEALHPTVLVDFARLILGRGIDVIYRARARFTNDLNPEACALLAKSGCRYLGLGLEAASPRINRLFNKHMGQPIDHGRIVEDLERAGVMPHIYAIMGFPTETRDEIARTRDFLIDQIKKRAYATVSANVFYFMRGSGAESDPRSVGIERVDYRGDIALVAEAHDLERDQNIQFAIDSAKRVYQAEFLPDVDDPEFAEAIWHFIDQTGIFYVQKVMFNANPFHELARRRKVATCCGDDDIGDIHLSPTPHFWMKGPPGYRLLCDWLTLNYARVPDWFVDVYDQLSGAEPIGVQIHRVASADQVDLARTLIVALAGQGFFLAEDDGGGISPLARGDEHIFLWKPEIEVRS